MSSTKEDYIPVPVEAAKQIAEQCKKSMVVIMCYDPVHEFTHVTTYGVEAFDKENAAAAGEICAKALGNLSKMQTYEDFHDDYEPAFCKEAMELLTTISRRQGTTPVQLQKIEKLLKARGKNLRQG